MDSTPQNPESHVATYDGVRIHWTEQGQGTPLVLLHGWGCEGKTLASIAAMTGHNHRVYSVDLPGFGESDEPPAVWGTDDYARCIASWMSDQGLIRPILLGHSFGGRISIILGSRGLASKIILVDSAGIKPRRSITYYFKVYSYKLQRRISQLILGRERSKALAQKALERRASADYLAASPRMRGILSRVVNEDLRSLLPHIDVPTLLIWGEDDTATPMRDARIMERLIPDAGLVSFAGCGHYSFLDNPAGFKAVINSFLS